MNATSIVHCALNNNNDRFGVMHLSIYVSHRSFLVQELNRHTEQTLNCRNQLSLRDYAFIFWGCVMSPNSTLRLVVKYYSFATT